jgi:hypothetical protein
VDADGDEDQARDALEPDIYNADLLRWVSSHLERAGYVEDAADETGLNLKEAGGLFGLLQLGQKAEKDEILSQIVRAVEALEDEEVEA